MLRITGLIAFLASCALAVLLFSRVQSLRLTGVAWNFGSPPLHVRLDTGPGSVDLLSWKSPWSLPAGLLSADNHRVTGLTFDDELYDGLREIPHDANVVLTHRGVEFRWLRLAFGGTVIESEGRTYACERTPARFFFWLSMISAGPLLVWLSVALITTILRPSRAIASPS